MVFKSSSYATTISHRTRALHKKEESGKKLKNLMCRQNKQDVVDDASGEIPSSSISKDEAKSGAVLNYTDQQKRLYDFKMFESLPPQLQFALLTISMFLFFGVHNLLQEAMMRIPGFKHGVMLGYMEVLGGE